MDPFHAAGRTIFLNRTGFNGLYRLNRQGQFNVSWGKKPGAHFLDEDNLRAVGKYLSHVEIHNEDFDTLTARVAKPGDFVFFDPPYLPVSATANFTSYTDQPFGLEHHEKLAALMTDLTRKGVHVLATNSHAPLVYEIYRDFEIIEYNTRRSINSKASTRRGVDVVIVPKR